MAFKLWHKHIPNFFGKDFQNSTAIASSAQFGKSEADTVVIREEGKLRIYTVVELNPVHRIRRHCTAIIQHEFREEIIATKKERIGNPH